MCIVFSHQVDGNVTAATGTHTPPLRNGICSPAHCRGQVWEGCPCLSLLTALLGGQNPPRSLAWALLSWLPGAPSRGREDNSSGYLSPAQPLAVFATCFQNIRETVCFAPAPLSLPWSQNPSLLPHRAPCFCPPCLPAGFPSSALLTFGAG